jgi:F-type H+-transporting ATPase subunit b
MDEILHQLGDLFLACIPTAVLFLLTLWLYRLLVYGPLTRALAERRARTTGALERAQAAIEAADAKSQEYEARLRAARAEIFRGREVRMQQWNRERENALEDARHAAQERVRAARIRLEAEAEEARRSIEGAADRLAGEILRAVLPATAGEAR